MNPHNLDYYRKAGRQLSGSLASGSQHPMDSLPPPPPPPVHTSYTREQAAADQTLIRKQSQRQRTISGGLIREGENRMGENTLLANEPLRGGGGLTGQEQFVGAQGHSVQTGPFQEGQSVPESVLYHQLELRNQRQRTTSGDQRMLGPGMDVLALHIGHQQHQRQPPRIMTQSISQNQVQRQQHRTHQVQSNPVSQFLPSPQGPYPPTQSPIDQRPQQPSYHVPQLTSAVESLPRVQNIPYVRPESSMFQTIMEQLSVMSARQDAAFKHLNIRVGDIENSIREMDLTSVVLGKRKADAMENEGDRMPDIANEASKQEGDLLQKSTMDMQSRTLRYLTLLAQRVGEVSRTVGGIEDALGTAGSAKGFTSAQKDKKHTVTSPDNVPSLAVPQNGDGSSKRASIDVDALDAVQEVAPTIHLGADKKSGLRGWMSTEVEHDLRPSYGVGRHSTPKYMGRSIMDRLESQEKILMDMAEWWENMRDPHADRRMESRYEIGVEGQEAELNDAQIPTLSQEPSVPPIPSPKPDAVESLPVRPQVPVSRSESLISNITDLIPTRSNVDIRISDSPLVSSTSTIGAFTATATADPRGMIMTDSLPSLTEGPVVRLHATGSAGIKLLDLAKTVINNRDNVSETEGDVALEVQTLEIPKDGGMMEVDWPRSSVREPDLERENTKSSSSSKTLASELITAYTTPVQTTDDDPISNHAPTTHPSALNVVVSTPKIEDKKSAHAPLTIKLRLAPLRLDMATASGSKRKGSISQPNSSNIRSNSVSTSQSGSVANAIPLNIPPSTSTTTPNNANRGAFTFSPVDWQAKTPTSPFVTPARAVRSLRSSSKRSTLPVSTSPSGGYRVLSTPTKSSSGIDVAERGIQGLLNAHTETPKKAYSLSTSGSLDLDSSAKRKSLTIRIPGSASHSRTPSQTGMSPGLFNLEDTSSKQTAKRALKGLINAIVKAPEKSFDISSEIAPESEADPSQKSLATGSESAFSPRKSTSLPSLKTPQKINQTLSIYDKSYALPPPPDGTVAALRQQALGSAFVYNGVGINSSPENDMDTTKTEEEASIPPEEPDPESELEEEIADTLERGEQDANAQDGSMNTVGEADASLLQPNVLEDGTPISPIVTEYASIVQSPIEPGHRRKSVSLHNDQIPAEKATLTSGTESQTKHSLSAITSWPPLTSQASAAIQSASFAELERPQRPPSSVHSLEPSSPGSPTDHITPGTEATPPKDQGDASSVQRAKSSALSQPINSVSDASVTVEAHEGMGLVMHTVFARLTQIDELPMSQVSATTEDEENVHSLVLDIAASSPSPHKPILRDTQAEPQDSDEERMQTPPHPHSASGRVHAAEIPEANDDFSPSIRTKLRSYTSPSPLFTSPSINAQDEGHLMTDSAENRMTYNRLLSVSPLRSQSLANEPELSGEDIVLQPENLLHVKQELDNSSSGITQLRSTLMTPKKNQALIYVSDSERPPQKLSTRITRSGKKAQKIRAPSVISISSDDEPPPKMKPAPSTIVETPKIDESEPARHEHDTTTATHAPMHSIPEISTFDDPLGTSTPLRNHNHGITEDKATSTVSAAPIADEPLTQDNMFTKELSPVSDLSQSPSPAPNSNDGRRECTAPVESPVANADISSFDLKKYTDGCISDEDMPTITKKNSKVSGISEAPFDIDSVRVGDKNTPTETVAPPKSLLNVQKRGKSAAVTRVKKRKGRPAEMDSDEDLRPLKKANLRKSKEGDAKAKRLDLKGKGTSDVPEKDKLRRKSERSPAKKVKAELVKTPTRLPRVKQPQPRTVKWPTIERPNYDQFIQCDSCYAWYHWGCVGIGTNDIRLDNSEIYKCPPCEAGVSSRDSESPNKHTEKFDDPQGNACSRPKCKRPKKIKVEAAPVEQETYVVESFIGRHRRMVGGKGILTYYLVKWHGYSYDQCTWEELDGMGLADPSALLTAFEKAAAEQDIDLDNVGDEHLLLEEAQSAGWQSDGFYQTPQ